MSLTAAIRAETEKLKHVIIYREAGFFSDLTGQLFQVVAMEGNGLSARSTDEQVLMTVIFAHNHMATIRAMHTLDQPKQLQLFKCAVHGDESKPGVSLPADGEKVHRVQGALRLHQLFDDDTPLRGNAVTACEQAVKPLICNGGLTHGLLISK